MGDKAGQRSRKKDNGLRENDRDDPRGIHFKRNVGILSAVHLAAHDAPGVLDRDLALRLRDQGDGKITPIKKQTIITSINGCSCAEPAPAEAGAINRINICMAEGAAERIPAVIIRDIPLPIPCS